MEDVEKLYHKHVNQAVLNFYKEIETYFTNLGYDFELVKEGNEYYFKLNKIAFKFTEDQASFEIYEDGMDGDTSDMVEYEDDTYYLLSFSKLEEIDKYFKEFFPTLASPKLKKARKTGLLEVKKFNEF
jgi:hypothetical protein